jgi:hypothetical protein
MNNLNKNSLLNRTRVARLPKGIHEDIVITKIDIADRKRNGILIKKMLYITFTKLDAEGKRKNEIELSWFRLDHSSEYLFSNMRELAIQLNGILNCYMSEDEAFAAMEGDINGLSFETVDDMENHKWKKSEVDAVMLDLMQRFSDAMTDKIGLESQRLRLKITTDNKGEGANIPSYGVFTESMEVAKEDSRLKFTDGELKNHSKAGNVSQNGTASATIKSI